MLLAFGTFVNFHITRRRSAKWLVLVDICCLAHNMPANEQMKGGGGIVRENY